MSEAGVKYVKQWRVGMRSGEAHWSVKCAPGWRVVQRCASLVDAAKYLAEQGADLTLVDVVSFNPWRPLSDFAGLKQKEPDHKNMGRPLTASEKLLKPCPFCGEDAFFVFNDGLDSPDESALYVRCSSVVDCPARTAAVYMCRKPTTAERTECETRLIEGWNRRVTT